jgi:transcriptional regulator with XRE-family HTH domain
MGSELWQRLRIARKYKNLTQKDIAAACHVSPSAVGQWEQKDNSKRTAPKFENLVEVSKITTAPLEWLQDDSAELDAEWLHIAHHDDEREEAPPDDYSDQEYQEPDQSFWDDALSYAVDMAREYTKLKQLNVYEYQNIQKQEESEPEFLITVPKFLQEKEVCGLKAIILPYSKHHLSTKMILVYTEDIKDLTKGEPNEELLQKIKSDYCIVNRRGRHRAVFFHAIKTNTKTFYLAEDLIRDEFINGMTSTDIDSLGLPKEYSDPLKRRIAEKITVVYEFSPSELVGVVMAMIRQTKSKSARIIFK